MIPSLLNVYEYNKKRKVNDIFIYEISKTYDKEYKEESLITGLLAGRFLVNDWNKSVNVDFYLVKGIVEDLLNYMGFDNRYSFEVSTNKGLHPGISAKILLDKQEIGYLGRIHPQVAKDTGENVSNDKKSLAFNLAFIDRNKTLTEEEVMLVFNKIIEKVEKTYNAVLRDK